MEIDQEKLCEYCKSVNEIPSNGMCEGCYCKETLESYMEDHGITETKTSFKSLAAGDIIFVIDSDILAEKELESVTSRKDGIDFVYDGICLECNKPNESSGSGGDSEWFMDKGVAIKRYESLMSEKIIKMANVLAEFK